MSTYGEARAVNPGRQPPPVPKPRKGTHARTSSSPSVGPPPVPSKFLMNDIPRGTSYSKLINSLLAPSHHDSDAEASPTSKLQPHVLCGLIITDSTLDDELSVATLEFSDTPTWLRVLNRDPCGFPKHTPLGTLWRGIDRHATDALGQSEFIRAVIRGNVGRGLYYAEMLAEFSDTDVNVQDHDGRTALHWACAGSLQDMVKLCLSVPGIQVGLRDKRGLTAFDLARQSGDEVAPALFYGCMLELDQSNPQAALLGVLTMSSEQVGGAGKPVFPGAAMFEPIESLNEPLVEALITRGVDLTVRNTEGDTALHVAVKTCGVEIVTRLLEAGSDVNAIGDGGATPLHHVARAADGENSQLDIAKLLLRHGADVDLKDKSGLTALQLAEGNEIADLVLMLKTVTMDSRLERAPVVVTSEELPAPMDDKELPIEMEVPMEAVVPAPIDDKELPIEMEMPMESVVPAPRSSTEHQVEKAVTVVLDPLAKAKHIMRALLSDVEAKFDNGQTALYQVVRRGDLEGVLVLLDLGANKEALNAKSYTALHQAAKRGYTDIVNALVASGSEIEAKTEDGLTALHLAATGDFTETVKALVESGSKIEAQTNDGLTALHLAATEGVTATVNTLVASGSQIGAMTTGGFTAFHLAATGSFTETVKALLDGGAQTEELTSLGDTALHLVAAKGLTETVKVLLDAGAKVEAMSHNGVAALHLAAKSGFTETVKALLDGGAKTEAMSRTGNTARHTAATGSFPASLGAHLDSMARTEAMSHTGNTALHMAATGCFTETVKALLDGGAKTEAMSHTGNTALHLAVRSRATKTVQALLDGGAKTEAINSDGYPALHIAVEKGFAETVKVLLDGGAQLEGSSRSPATHEWRMQSRGMPGITALHLAASRGNMKTLKTLIDCGAKVEAKTHQGETALHLAVINGHATAAKALVVGGAGIEAITGWEGFTALHLAAELGNQARGKDWMHEHHWGSKYGRDCLETITTLLECGAKLEAMTPKGYTALHLAAMKGISNNVKALLDRGAKIDAIGADRYTALQMAVTGGSSPTVRTLLIAGAQTEVMTDKGCTALHMAVEGPYTWDKGQMVEALAKHGVKLEARSPDGTAMQIASKEENKEMVDILRASGARTAVGRFGYAIIDRLGLKDPAK